MQSRSKDAFPIDIRKNPKDCTVVTLRSGRKQESRREKYKKKTEKVEESEIAKENKKNDSDVVEETEIEKVQIEQLVEREEERGETNLHVYCSVPLEASESKNGRAVR